MRIPFHEDPIPKGAGSISSAFATIYFGFWASGPIGTAPFAPCPGTPPLPREPVHRPAVAHLWSHPVTSFGDCDTPFVTYSRSNRGVPSGWMYCVSGRSIVIRVGSWLIVLGCSGQHRRTPQHRRLSLLIFLHDGFNLVGRHLAVHILIDHHGWRPFALSQACDRQDGQAPVARCLPRSMSYCF